MPIQTSTSDKVFGFPLGFGARLRDERKRLKLSQAEFAQVGGVGRLAQLQYEAEVTAPTTRYLSLIASAGADLSYLVLGIRFNEGRLTPTQEERINEKTIEWIDAYAETQPDGRIGTDTRKALDRVIRNLLRQIERGELPADFDAMALIVNQTSGVGRR